MPVIQHDDNTSCRLQHAVDLVDGFLSIRSMMKDAKRVDNVEGVVGKREPFSIRNLGIPGHTIHGKSFLYQFDACRGEIDACHKSSSPGKLEQVCPQSASYFEQAFAFESVELHYPTHEWLRFVAIALHFVVELPRPANKMSKLRPARIGVPVFPNLLLQFFVIPFHQFKLL